MSRSTAAELSQEPREEFNYLQYADGKCAPAAGALPEELALHLVINGIEFATIMCTPEKLNFLVLGFLRAEGLVTGPDDVTLMRVCIPDGVAEVRLSHAVELPKKRVITTGCGGGVVFDQTATFPPVVSGVRFTPEQIFQAMRRLQPSGDIKPGSHQRMMGMHACALSNGSQVLVEARDIGRHNALDKVWGECMLSDIPTSDNLLVTTGRISSEMLVKVGMMGVPVVASLNSATRRAVELGDKVGVTIIGYARGSRLSVYTHPERIVMHA